MSLTGPTVGHDVRMVYPLGPRSRRPLRVMTWNIRSLRDDRSAVVRVVQTFAPDLLLLQEVPRFVRARSRLAALARESGLVVAAGAGREVAVLTTLRLNVADSQTVELSSTRGLHRRWVAMARLSFPDVEVAVAAVHLGLDAAERLRHVAEIRTELANFGGTDVLVGGDLNESADSRAWGTLNEGLTDAGAKSAEPTYPAADPRQRIDTIFAPLAWQLRTVTAVDVGCDADIVRASDHRPLVVDVVG